MVLPYCLGQDVDSDGDGLSDFHEQHKYLTDPQNADSDGDFLTDYAEAFLCTQRLNPDTDNDGFSDKDELDFAADPCDANSIPANVFLKYFLATGNNVTVLNSATPVIGNYANSVGSAFITGPDISIENTAAPVIFPFIVNSTGTVFVDGPVVSIRNDAVPPIEPFGAVSNGVAGGPAISIQNSP